MKTVESVFGLLSVEQYYIAVYNHMLTLEEYCKIHTDVNGSYFGIKLTKDMISEALALSVLNGKEFHNFTILNTQVFSILHNGIPVQYRVEVLIER